MSINKKFSLEEIVKCIETWLIEGNIDANILADNFKFISTFWKGSNKAEIHRFVQQGNEFKSNTGTNPESLSTRVVRRANFQNFRRHPFAI